MHSRLLNQCDQRSEDIRCVAVLAVCASILPQFYASSLKEEGEGELIVNGFEQVCVVRICAY